MNPPQSTAIITGDQLLSTADAVHVFIGGADATVVFAGEAPQSAAGVFHERSYSWYDFAWLIRSGSGAGGGVSSNSTMAIAVE